MFNTVARSLGAAVFMVCLVGTAPAGYDVRSTLSGFEDQAAAFDEWRSLAEAGDARAQTSLGYLYAEGAGVEQSDEEAVYWWKKAAALGESSAQHNLGLCYIHGRGVAQDYCEASRWLQRSAGLGNAAAAFDLGLLYLDGLGVPQNDRRAFKWFEKAAIQGFADAQNSLGTLYDTGRGVAQDDCEAVRWYREAALQHCACAEFNLGGFYAQGRGVPQNLVRAYTWLSLALEGGDAGALEWLVLVAGQMTDVEITEANALAADWERVKETEYTDPWYGTSPLTFSPYSYSEVGPIKTSGERGR